MPSRQRFVVVGLLLLAAVVGTALSHGLAWIWTELNLTDPLPLGMRELPLTTLLGYGLALGAAGFIIKHGPSHTLAVEIVDELARVTWPSRQETGNATWVVIVAVVVCSAYLGLFDAIWLAVTNFILGVQGPTTG